MKILFQYVKYAKIWEKDKIVGEISRGVLIYIGIDIDDTDEDVIKMVHVILNTYLIPNERGRMEQSVTSAKLPLMAISQFTLCADVSGKKPSFINAKPPAKAAILYHQLIDRLRQCTTVVSGNFGSYLQIESNNDGPVNFLLQ